MRTYKIDKILVPVDLSESSLNALDTAVALAVKNKAAIQILHIKEKDIDSHDEATFSDVHLSLDSSDVLMALSNSILHTHAIKIKVLNDQGNISDTIIKCASIQKPDLIVMGTHGASGFRDGFMGSNTYRVIKNANCPVLSVPNKRKYLGFKKVLFPIRPVTGALLRYDVVCHLINMHANINVLGLTYRKVDKEINVLDKILEEIKDQLTQDKINATVSWGEGDILADDVIKVAQQNIYDLVVITTVLDVATKPNFIGPHTQKIINCLKLPILSIKNNCMPSLA